VKTDNSKSHFNPNDVLLSQCKSVIFICLFVVMNESEQVSERTVINYKIHVLGILELIVKFDFVL